jgi:hypothetical protein
MYIARVPRVRHSAAGVMVAANDVFKCTAARRGITRKQPANHFDMCVLNNHLHRIHAVLVLVSAAIQLGQRRSAGAFQPQQRGAGRASHVLLTTRSFCGTPISQCNRAGRAHRTRHNYGESLSASAAQPS